PMDRRTVAVAVRWRVHAGETAVSWRATARRAPHAFISAARAARMDTPSHDGLVFRAGDRGRRREHSVRPFEALRSARIRPGARHHPRRVARGCRTSATLHLTHPAFVTARPALWLRLQIAHAERDRVFPSRSPREQA